MDTIKIPVGNNRFTVVDSLDRDLLFLCSWYLGNKDHVRSSTVKKEFLSIIIAKRMGLNTEKYDIDHEDRDPLNNRRSNLREATRSQNNANSDFLSDNKLGIKGVRRSGKKYRAQITVNGKGINLGSFDSVDEAADAYEQAARKYFGEFACT